MYQFRDTYITHKRRHNELRKRNRSDYPELETLEDGDQRVKLPKFRDRRGPGYTFQEAMDYLNGKDGFVSNLCVEAELQRSRSETVSAEQSVDQPHEEEEKVQNLGSTDMTEIKA